MKGPESALGQGRTAACRWQSGGYEACRRAGTGRPVRVRPRHHGERSGARGGAVIACWRRGTCTNWARAWDIDLPEKLAPAACHRAPYRRNPRSVQTPAAAGTLARAQDRQDRCCAPRGRRATSTCAARGGFTRYCAGLPENERAAAEPLQARLEAERVRASARIVRVLDCEFLHRAAGFRNLELSRARKPRPGNWAFSPDRADGGHAGARTRPLSQAQENPSAA